MSKVKIELELPEVIILVISMILSALSFWFLPGLAAWIITVALVLAFLHLHLGLPIPR